MNHFSFHTKKYYLETTCREILTRTFFLDQEKCSLFPSWSRKFQRPLEGTFLSLLIKKKTKKSKYFLSQPNVMWHDDGQRNSPMFQDFQIAPRISPSVRLRGSGLTFYLSASGGAHFNTLPSRWIPKALTPFESDKIRVREWLSEPFELEFLYPVLCQSTSLCTLACWYCRCAICLPQSGPFNSYWKDRFRCGIP